MVVSGSASELGLTRRQGGGLHRDFLCATCLVGRAIELLELAHEIAEDHRRAVMARRRVSACARPRFADGFWHARGGDVIADLSFVGG